MFCGFLRHCGLRHRQFLGYWAVKYYRYLWVIAVYIGSVVSLPTVWNFADCANALMAIPNRISLIALHGIIAKDTSLYFKAKPAVA